VKKKPTPVQRKPARKQTRDLARSRKEILDAAFPLIFQRGFQGVSIDDIVNATSLTKGAFYHQFPTKLDLGYALLDEVIKPMILSRWIAPLAACENSLAGILKQLRTLIGDASPSELKLGCPLNNLVQEMSAVDAEFKRRLELALELWISGLEAELSRAKREGYLKKDVNARQVAHFLVMAHEGFYGILKGLDDPRAFDALYSSLKLFFKTIEA
jgi:TetR/AcrR family transcriptional regulator, transcriptional repressor for nem operon